MATIYDFEIEYDPAKDKYYLSKNCGDLIGDFLRCMGIERIFIQ